MTFVWIVFIWLALLIIYYAWKWRKEKKRKEKKESVAISKRLMKKYNNRMNMSVGKRIKYKRRVDK